VTAPDPIALAQQWLDAAVRSGAPQPEAMALATANEQGHPSVRMVLMRGLDQEGFRFYTNRESRKGDELAANPWGAIAFYWEPPGLQLRAEGPVRPLDDAASDAYFASRPRESQLGAWASQQSRELESREVLCNRVLGARRAPAAPAPPVPPKRRRLDAAPARALTPEDVQAEPKPFTLAQCTRPKIAGTMERATLGGVR
jgi:pyridoxamine 5'-phosphate oxidase